MWLLIVFLALCTTHSNAMFQDEDDQDTVQGDPGQGVPPMPIDDGTGAAPGPLQPLAVTVSSDSSDDEETNMFFQDIGLGNATHGAAAVEAAGGGNGARGAAAAARPRRRHPAVQAGGAAAAARPRRHRRRVRAESSDDEETNIFVQDIELQADRRGMQPGYDGAGARVVGKQRP